MKALAPERELLLIRELLSIRALGAAIGVIGPELEIIPFPVL